MNKKRVDIIMGVYNCEKYVRDSIESILNQSYSNWRLIICDDGSTDGTYEMVKKISNDNSKIILLKNEKNMGLNYTLNKCLEQCSSGYIARMDADDVCDRTRIEKEIMFLENNKDFAFVSCNSILFDENGVWGTLKLKEKPLRKDFLKISPFCHAAVMIRKKVLDEVGGYSVDDKLLRVEDYHLWFKIYSKGYFGYNIQDCLYSIRDDRNAANRRNWKNRKNEYYVKKIGFKMLNIPWYLRFYQYRPIILGLIPNKFYEILHKTKLRNKK